MRIRGTHAAIAALGIAALGGGAAIAGATSGGDDDTTERQITGAARERAEDAALRHTGGGRVTGTEAGDEEGAYEVEVTRTGGGSVDVHLDRDFRVLGTEGDGGEDDGSGDD